MSTLSNMLIEFGEIDMWIFLGPLMECEGYYISFVLAYHYIWRLSIMENLLGFYPLCWGGLESMLHIWRT